MTGRGGWIGFLYLTPALLFVGAFVLYPLGQLVYLSLPSSSLPGGSEFIGLRNYIRAFTDQTFWHSLQFTIKYTVLITPILIGLGYLLALLTAGTAAIGRFTRAVVFLP
ncbi:MAG: sugar ABC transporter permease, partial [Methylobacteriaceae bacterium]|nr:sugar ABC transporter permease [Methylobacteriaceae bacterium]